MHNVDFVVKYDPTVDKPEILSRRILYSLFVRRLQAKKPVVIFIGGDSGEGKSYAVLKLQEEIYKIYGIELAENLDFVDVMNVFIPVQYPEKLDKILNDKNFKPVHLLAVHEARDLIKAKLWHNFVSMAIADVNAQVRAVKRLMIFIVSQFIRDITTDMRYTLTYYATVERPNSTSAPARLRLSRMYKDDRDLENPRLGKRRINGFVILPDGRWRYYSPSHIILSKPSATICDYFDAKDREAKGNIIKAKLDKLIKTMQLELDVGNPKVDAMVKFYIEHPENLRLIGKRSRNKWKLTSNVIAMHDLTKKEFADFQFKLNDALSRTIPNYDDIPEKAESSDEIDDEVKYNDETLPEE